MTGILGMGKKKSALNAEISRSILRGCNVSDGVSNK